MRGCRSTHLLTLLTLQRICRFSFDLVGGLGQLCFLGFGMTVQEGLLGGMLLVGGVGCWVLRDEGMDGS